MKNRTSNWRIPRRTVLKGIGAALALPWLEVMSANAEDVTTAGSMAKHEIPRRALFTYWGLGLEIRAFTPADQGKGYTLSSTLQPLAPYKDECTVFTGLSSYSGGHGSCSCLLTGLNTAIGAESVDTGQLQGDDGRGRQTTPRKWADRGFSARLF